MADTKNVGKVLDKLKEKVDEEEIARNLENCPIQNAFLRKNLVTIPAALSLVGLFLPFMAFSGGIDVQSGSALGLFGGDYGSPATLLLIVLPVLVIVANYVGKLKPYRRIISIAAPVLSVIGLFITFAATRSSFLAAMEKQAQDVNAFTSMVGVQTESSASCGEQFGFYILLLSYVLTVLAGMVAYFGFSFTKKK